jgi:hypothetical protein
MLSAKQETSVGYLFQNRQWGVTEWGLQSIQPGAPYEYNIEAERLLETGNDGTPLYDWPFHMGEKTWIDMSAFEEAFREALRIHSGKYEGTVDSALLDQSFAAGRARSR